MPAPLHLSVAAGEGLGIGGVPWVGGARTIRDLNGVEARVISGEMAFIFPVLIESILIQTKV